MSDRQLTLENALKLAVEHHKSGQIQEAEKLYRAILQSFPKHADANHNLGVIAFQVGKVELGLPYLKLALETNPQNFVYWLSYAECLLLSGKPKETLEILSQGKKQGLSGTKYDDLINKAREDIRAMENPLFLALSLWKKGEAEPAIHWLYDFVGKHPNDFQALSQLGEFLRHQDGRWEESVTILERAIKIRKDSAITFLSYGTALRQLGRKKEAIVAFRRALAINPKLYEAANDLAGLLFEDDNVEEAIRLYEKVCTLIPNIAVFYMNLATALAKADRLAEAEAIAQKAYRLDTDGSSGASMFLASLKVYPIPERIPDALLHKLYNSRASTWDKNSTLETSPYKGADLVANALSSLKPNRNLDILDAGCGTGLLGPLVKNWSNQLDGVDLSLPMLEKAKQKDVYTKLFHGDLIEVLKASHNSYDAIISAATLIHFGSLQHIFELCSVALRPGGYFIFTVFPNDEDPDTYAVEAINGLAQGGCFVHGELYLSRLSVETGFKILSLSREIHEYSSKNIPKYCLVISLIRSETKNPTT